MKSTPIFGLPYPESGDHTRTWEYWQSLAEATDPLLWTAGRPCTSTTRPAATAGKRIYETDTGRILIGVTVGGTSYWIPQPGTFIFAVRQTTVQSLPDGVYTPLNFQAVDYDPFTIWVPGSPTKFQSKFPGWFDMNGGASFASNTVNYRATIWYKNGAYINGSTSNQTGTAGIGTATVGRPTPIYLNGTTDYVEFNAIQTSGAALNTSVTNQYQSTMWAKYLGP